MSQIRAEESDVDQLYFQVVDCDNLSNQTEEDNAIIAIVGILREQDRRIKRLFDRVNNIGLVIDRNGKTTFEKFQELETRIIDMGFPT